MREIAWVRRGRDVRGDCVASGEGMERAVGGLCEVSLKPVEVGGAGGFEAVDGVRGGEVGGKVGGWEGEVEEEEDVGFFWAVVGEGYGGGLVHGCCGEG